MYKLISLAALAGIVAASPLAANATTGANTSPAWVTETVTALTTYCPSATQITQGGKTYTVTTAATLTITDCPCTVVKPSSAPAAPPVSQAPVATPPAPGKPAPVGNYTQPAAPPVAAPPSAAPPAAPPAAAPQAGSPAPAAPSAQVSAAPGPTAPIGSNRPIASPSRTIAIAGAERLTGSFEAAVAAVLAAMFL